MHKYCSQRLKGFEFTEHKKRRKTVVDFCLHFSVDKTLNYFCKLSFLTAALNDLTVFGGIRCSESVFTNCFVLIM